MPGLSGETWLVVSTLTMLANVVMLGLMHRDLPRTLRQATLTWQAGTLLLAGGCAVFAVQERLPVAATATVANVLILLGMTGYWQALRRFYGYRTSAWILLPVIGGTFGILVYATLVPDAYARILVASAARLVIAASCIWMLRREARTDSAPTRAAMTIAFVVLMAFVVARAVLLGSLDLPPTFLPVANAHLLNQTAMAIGVTMPLLASTAFVLMCSGRVRRQWEEAASTDFLTGLANRRTLTDAGVRRFPGTRGDTGGALAMIDVDDFKMVNDAHGHEVGDAVLKHIARRLAAVTRGGEILGRFGGEEFVVLLDDITHDDEATAAAERLRLSVQDHPFTDATRQRVTATVSIGVAVAGAGEDFASLVRRADRALYVAKGLGRNRVEVACDAPMESVAEAVAS